MAINDKNVLSESWNNQPKLDVRTALQAKLRDMVSKITQAANQAPSSVDIEVNNGIVELTVTLADGSTKKSSVSVADLTAEITEALRKKASIETNTGRISYSVLPDLVLATMGHELDGTSDDIDVSTLKEVFIYNPNLKHIDYVTKFGRADSGFAPKVGLIYCNAQTGKLYRWDAVVEDMVPLLPGKADLSNGMLDPRQWPKVVLRTIDDDLIQFNPGDMSFDAAGYIYLWLANSNVNMGSPVKGTIYYVQDKKKFYRWNGQTFVEALDIPTKTSQLDNDSGFLTEHQALKTINGETITGEGNITISASQGSISIDTALDEDSPNAIANSAVAAAIAELSDYLNILGDDRILKPSLIPSVILDSLDYEFTPSQDDTYSDALAGKTLMCDDGKIRHFYYQSNGIRNEVRMYESLPSEGVVYWDKESGKTYRWDRAESQLFLIGHDPDTKTDKDANTARLKWSQAPNVVLASMGRELDNASNTSSSMYSYVKKAGDTVYDPTTKKIIFYPSRYAQYEYDPEEGLIYCNKHTNRLYRWTGSAMQQVGGSGSGSGSGAPIEVTTLYGGRFQEALERANSASDTMFQWILIDTDPVTGETFRKIIWHVGGGEFIDALGSVIELDN